ncbi:acetyl-CoA C-acyltransferase [Lacimicrobium alkaliphilum]|uniref:Acetyl-CoA acetyltransferase n=1 Tax=Lacimicrobium alkaliphilum TaxID=1526571 RepID=A0A0U3B492_9ALTE|nr:acetyl-CoA C-acyltransferase [Lacimicrobium alkaliphilum]ALS99872.1 acetyl-CoA acetyltransferase [Lacimicrobium alkaliphilum]
MTQAYIYDAIRTPRTKAREEGELHDLMPYDLLGTLYTALQNRTQLDPELVGDVILGCATQAGEQAANIAKTSTLYAGWPGSIPGITVNRYCSSGIDAINMAAMKVMCGMDQLVVAGGVEMMSRVAMLSDKPRPFMDAKLAARMGMFMMGSGADLIASLHGYSRQEVDAVALLSQQRAAHAREQGYFKSVVPVTNPVKGCEVTQDKLIREKTSAESLAKMSLAFADMGAKGVDQMMLQAFPQLEQMTHVHTAGNSPAMADGAAVLLIGSQAAAKQLSQQPRARIVAMKNVNDDTRMVVGGCVAATRALMAEQGLTSDDIDLFEIHEAFGATILRCKQELEIDDSKLNVNGGCIALGHPLGATGAMMAGTLLDELERRNLKTGIVAASGAAGTGTALMIERV